MKRDPLPAHVMATRLIPNVSPDMAKELGLAPDQKSLAIITADSRVDTTRESIRFALKPHKVFLFHRDTQVRLDCTLR